MAGALLCDTGGVEERDEDLRDDPLDDPEHVLALGGVHHTAHDLSLEGFLAQNSPGEILDVILIS